MGLDMYALAFPATAARGDLDIDGDAEGTHLMYWRKHHDLHGWMQRLWAAKGGQGGPGGFNCQPVRLDLADLDRLEADIKANRLPQTEGFFFGNNPPDEESMAQDMEFVSKAREAINSGQVVYYDSWW